MKNMNWDDLRIFAQVAREGGLSGAARALKISVPTVGRRMLALEKASGLVLFERSQAGYTLTKDGQALSAKVRAMESAARPLEDWLSLEGTRPLVRISAGTATASFMAENISRLWQPSDPFRLAFVTTEARLDIGHREVDIGIRNQPAETGNLASRKLQVLRFAPFKNRHRLWEGEAEWVAIDSESARHPAAKWVLARENIAICAWANSVATARDMVRGGAGIGVMPCFAGDRDPVLIRAGPLIEELTEMPWLVMHDDDRHRPEIRTTIERITQFFSDHAPLLAGERPLTD
jgi:DNA-binding transcriptional LysR family regulator